MSRRLARLAARSRSQMSEAAVAARYWARFPGPDPELARMLAARMKEVTPND